MIALAANATVPRQRAAIPPSQFVVFTLAGESYALPIQQVRKVIRFQQITSMPKSAPFVEGILSLRGRIIAVVGLRAQLGLPRAEVNNATRILVGRLPSTLIGLVVDSVQEVLSIPSEAIQPMPEAIRQPGDAHYSSGIARVGPRLILLLELVALFSPQETRQLQDLQADLQKGTAHG